MDENGGRAGRIIRASGRVIVLRLTSSVPRGEARVGQHIGFGIVPIGAASFDTRGRNTEPGQSEPMPTNSVVPAQEPVKEMAGTVGE